METITATNPVKGADVSKAIDKTIETVSWGRRGKVAWNGFLGAALITAWCPVWMALNWTALEHGGGSLTEATKLLLKNGLVRFFWKYFPLPTTTSIFYYAVWTAFQATLYTVLPGRRVKGQQTPGGHLLEYTTNGLLAWGITHGLAVAGVYAGYLDPALIAVNWGGFLGVVNIYGFVLGFALFLKGYFAPSYKTDQKLTGSWLFDFTFGVELNPRLGKNWDLKFFHNSRPGIVAWTLIDLSWAAFQYQKFGYITWSMVVANILHAIYVLDFFVNEDWYTRTIDITHDHLGFLLAWGDVMFLPTFYTLQTQYLARYPGNDSFLKAGSVLAVGVASYLMFRSANNQRDHVRRMDGKTTIWDRPAQFLRCTYQTVDGKSHNSILLTSGWWGVVRHPNYLADLILSASMCATCGFKHILPWSYLIFMTILLITRSQRDDRRCRAKYGEKWVEYCQLVPYQIVPGVF